MASNPFLIKLLSLQQDGKGAISAPSNWIAEPPLLDVETDLDHLVDDLSVTTLYGAGANHTARWHIFVGSPGNGKSAYVGKLVRHLRNSGCEILTEEGCDIGSLQAGQVPYLLEVFEPGNKFATIWIAQDASVVRNPFAPDVDPSEELIRLLELASAKGVSLIVCTNRGVIEKAFRRVYLDQSRNKHAWFKAMKTAVEGGKALDLSFEPIKGERQVFSRMHFDYTKLDRRSLLIKNDTFQKLLAKATSAENWSACQDCESNGMCPFNQNREWLATTGGSEALLSLLQKAELLSGQIIVFREALALLSFSLSGCPRDYRDLSPCQWVSQKLVAKDIFSLLSRRIYMSLFSSYAPFGLETSDSICRTQKRYLGEIANTLDQHSSAAKALKHVLFPGNTVSTDVGVQRLLGPAGYFRTLDPLNEVLPGEFYDTWDASVTGHGISGPLASPLELAAKACWDEMLSAIQNSWESAKDHYRWLSRWITAFSFRLGALTEQRVAFDRELQELIQILQLQDSKMTPEMAKRISDIQQELRTILGEKDAGIQVADYVRLSGEWVARKLRPTIDTEGGSDSMAISIRFPGEERVALSGETFVWLKRRLDYSMSAASFPREYLDAARDALVRAAAHSEYAWQDDDVEIEVRTHGRLISLKRVMGMVVVDERSDD